MTPSAVLRAIGLLFAIGLGAGAQAQAQALAPPEGGAPEGAAAPVARPAPLRYQIGLAVTRKPTYAGSESMGNGVRPVIAIEWGRLRLSSSQAGLVEGSAADGSRAAGASFSLAESARWSSGVALRLDGGRSAADDPRLAGLPEVRSTLRGRLYGRYSLEGSADDRRSVGATLSSDLLGRQGGTVLSVDLSRRVVLSPTVRWTQGLGLGMADTTYLRSYHGVTAAGAAASGLPVYRPQTGLTDVHAGTGMTWRLHGRWRVGGALGASYLLGPAADSPLTQRRLGYSMTVGLVYISQDD